MYLLCQLLDGNAMLVLIYISMYWREERRLIISKLLGHIVHLSQHKFALNIVEKCLEYGGAAKQELLIGEIFGHMEGTDNLLVS